MEGTEEEVRLVRVGVCCCCCCPNKERDERDDLEVEVVGEKIEERPGEAGGGSWEVELEEEEGTAGKMKMGCEGS